MSLSTTPIPAAVWERVIVDTEYVDARRGYVADMPGVHADAVLSVRLECAQRMHDRTVALMDEYRKNGGVL